MSLVFGSPLKRKESPGAVMQISSEQELIENIVDVLTGIGQAIWISIQREILDQFPKPFDWISIVLK